MLLGLLRLQLLYRSCIDLVSARSVFIEIHDVVKSAGGARSLPKVTEFFVRARTR